MNQLAIVLSNTPAGLVSERYGVLAREMDGARVIETQGCRWAGPIRGTPGPKNGRFDVVPPGDEGTGDQRREKLDN